MSSPFQRPPHGSIAADMCILQPIPPVLIQILDAPKDGWRLYLHFLEKGSFPCLGDRCQHCHLRQIDYAYVPVALLHMGSLYTPPMIVKYRILPLTANVAHLADQNHDGIIYEASRDGNMTNGKVNLKVITREKPVGGRSFPVKPHLLRRWHIDADGAPRKPRMKQLTAEIGAMPDE